MKRRLGRCLCLAWLSALLCATQARAQTASGAPDSLLSAPPARAAQELASWAQAKQWIERRQPVLAKSAAAVAQAEATARGALARMLPQLQTSAGLEYNSGRANSFTSAAGATVPGASVLLVSTLSAADLRSHSAARAGLAAERLGLAAARHALLGALAATLLDVVAAERIAERNRTGLAAALERLRLTERLLELGRATALDVARFAQDQFEAESAVVRGDEALWQAREALGNALGLGEPVGIAAAFEAALFPDALELPGCRPLAAVPERADLRAAEQRAQRAERAVGAARLAYLPELQLSASYSAIHASFPPGAEAAWLQNVSVTANLAWTVLEGGQRRANVQTARAELSAARAEQRALAIATETEARRAQRLTSVARANLDIALRELAAAQTADGLSRRAFELGQASALEGVDSARRLRNAEITRALRDVELVAAELRARLVLTQCQ